jgi:hypothetical protein
MKKNQILNNKLDIDDPARVLLQVKAAFSSGVAVLRIFTRISRTSWASFSLFLFRDMTSLRISVKRSQTFRIPIDGAGLYNCLVFPAPCLIELVLLERFHLADKNTRVTTGPKAHIRFVQFPGGRRGRQKMDNTLAQPRDKTRNHKGTECTAAGLAMFCGVQKNKVQV